MKARWNKLRALSFFEAWFLVKAAAAVVAFDLVFRVFSTKTCLALCERRAAAHSARGEVNTGRLAWLVDVADRYTPGKSSCLRRATALAWLLRRMGLATRLRIGVAREGEKLVAHSWVESGDGEPYGLPEKDRYSPLPVLAEPLRMGCER